MNVTIQTDDRGVEYAEDMDLSTLPKGWALCPTCGRAWNDEKSTSVTPTPAARCPFEYEHDDEPIISYDDPSDPIGDWRTVKAPGNLDQTEQIAVGTKLPNGAIVVSSMWTRRREGFVILAVQGGYEPYVTWISGKDLGTTSWGHYHQSLADALVDFAQRCKSRGERS